MELSLEGVLPLLKPFIETLAGQNGVVLQVLSAAVALIGSVRLFVKPVITFLEKIVLLTPTTKDNTVLEAVKKSPALRVALFLADYLFSLKLPTKNVVAKVEPK